jgi:hypothetical protein
LRNRTVRCGGIFTIFILALCALPQHAGAIPLFAQRYRLQCGACHSVLPELNSFGVAFRNQGYQLPLPKHGTSGVAVRVQGEYEANPAPGSKPYTAGEVLLSNADIGKISAFVHYNLGAQGGPAGLFLGYLATYNAHTQSLYRAGLFELPLAQSPGQRLDDLQGYGYYGTHVGLNDLALGSPRWGAQFERTFGAFSGDLTISTGEFKGAAYGGKPIPTGETTSARSPEYGFFLRTQAMPGLTLGGEWIAGTRWIVPVGTGGFPDGYYRTGLLMQAVSGRWNLQAEQWWGRDADSDGFGTVLGSSGGYARLKYYPTPHSYIGVRYDTSANPFVTRDMVYYFAFHVTPHARLLIQQVQTIGGQSHFGAAITVGAPWPAKL